MTTIRGIDQGWIERTVEAPERLERDPSDPEAWRAFRAVPERDGRVLRVAYVLESEGVARVTTAFLDRSRRR